MGRETVGMVLEATSVTGEVSGWCGRSLRSSPRSCHFKGRTEWLGLV